MYNYLGNLTARPLPDPDNATLAPPDSNPAEGMPCDTTVNVCPEPLVCVGWRYGTKDATGMGRCRNTTTLYVPAYSTRWGRGAGGRGSGGGSRGGKWGSGKGRHQRGRCHRAGTVAVGRKASGWLSEAQVQYGPV